jgi:general secretion pathway protein L
MTGVIYLHLPCDFSPGEDDRVHWLDVRGQLHADSRLVEVAAQAVGTRVVVLVPAKDVVLLEAEVPTRNRHELSKAVPYAVEDQLSAEVESLHFATGARAGSRVAVAAVAKDRMGEWQEALTQAGIEPNAMIPASLALPLEEGDWSLLIGDGAATLRTGPQSASSLPPGKLDLLLGLSLESAGTDRPPRLRCFNVSAEPEPEAVLQRICREAEIEAVVSRPGDLLELCPEGLDEGVAINLMQGDFARRDRFARYWRPWRGAAALLLALLVLASVEASYDYVQLRREDAGLRERVERIYREVFPETRNIVDPRLQMEQQLKALEGDEGQDDFLRLLSVVGPVLRKAPSLDIKSMSYRQSSLDFELWIRDFQSLDDLKEQLENLAGLEISVTAANAELGRVRGQLRIQWSGS